MVMLPLVCMNFYVLVLPNSCLIIPLCGNNIMLLKLNYTLYVCYHFLIYVLVVYKQRIFFIF
jgi:hypothetical protein